MAPLAVVARHLGAEVTGCDRAPADEPAEWLLAQGLGFARSHGAEHLEAGATAVATSVADGSDPEVVAARAQGLWHRTDLLAHVLRQQPSVGVTGSHGKGTVAALTTAALAAAGFDPSALLGLAAPELGGFARLGSGPVVAEVDDSDNSLSRVDTDVSVVTALDDDHPHLDVTLEQKVQGVGEYVGRASRRVLLGDSPRAARLSSYAHAEVWRYGHELSGRVVDRSRAGTVVRLRAPDGVQAEARLRTIVVRAEMNAALAWAAALSLGADPEAAATGLGDLTTLTRRMQLLGEHEGVAVVDDMGAKHPAAIRGALDTLRRHYPAGRVVAVFEPFGLFLPRWGNRYARALSGADEVLLLPPFGLADYASGSSHDPDWYLPCRAPVRQVADHAAVVAEARKVTRPGDVLVVLTHRGASRHLARSVLTGEHA